MHSCQEPPYHAREWNFSLKTLVDLTYCPSKHDLINYYWTKVIVYAHLFRVLVIILLTVHGIWMMLHVTVHYKSSQHLILQNHAQNWSTKRNDLTWLWTRLSYEVLCIWVSEACDENKVLDVFILNADLVPPSFSSDVLTGMFGFLETCHAHRFRFFF